MVMLWPDGDDFRLQSAMNLWVAETNYPGYKDLEELFIDKGPDQSSVKTIYNGWQFDTTEKIQKQYIYFLPVITKVPAIHGYINPRVDYLYKR